MDKTGNSPQRDEDVGLALIQTLVENNVITQAQANVVRVDHESTGISVEDLLIARNWVEPGRLAEIMEAAGVGKSTVEGDKTRSYEENLRQYRSLLAEILGESSE